MVEAAARVQQVKVGEVMDGGETSFEWIGLLPSVLAALAGLAGALIGGRAVLNSQRSMIEAQMRRERNGRILEERARTIIPVRDALAAVLQSWADYAAAASSPWNVDHYEQVHADAISEIKRALSKVTDVELKTLCGNALRPIDSILSLPEWTNAPSTVEAAAFLRSAIDALKPEVEPHREEFMRRSEWLIEGRDLEW